MSEQAKGGLMADLTLVELAQWARQAGLNLADEELARLLPGVQRSRAHAAELRSLAGENIEPAGIFIAHKEPQR